MKAKDINVSEIEVSYCPINDGDCRRCQYCEDINSYKGAFSGSWVVYVSCTYEELNEELEDEE